MLDKWHKKEKPVFTGIARGIGGIGSVRCSFTDCCFSGNVSSARYFNTNLLASAHQPGDQT